MSHDALPPSAKAVFEARELSRPTNVYQVDGRSKSERRQTPDRREMIRFQEDRRSGQDRRPTAGWQRGVTI